MALALPSERESHYKPLGQRQPLAVKQTKVAIANQRCWGWRRGFVCLWKGISITETRSARHISGAVTMDCANGSNVQFLTLTNNSTSFAASNRSQGRFALCILQRRHSTMNITSSSTVKFSGGAFVITAGTNTHDQLICASPMVAPCIVVILTTSAIDNPVRAAYPARNWQN